MTFEDPTWLQGLAGDPSYSAREDRIVLDLLWDEGVIDLSSFAATQRAAGANFTVDVSTGTAIVQGDDQTNQGKYIAKMTVAESVAINSAPGGTNQRYDLICVAVNDPDATNTRTPANRSQLLYVAGTPAAAGTAVPPTVPPTAVPIAIIGPVVAGTSSIVNSMIHDAHTGTYAGPAYTPIVRPVAGYRDTPGTVKHYSGKLSAIPAGWAAAYGQSYSTTAQPRLFAHTGYVFGGTGANFNAPDTRGRVLMSPDNMGGSAASRVAGATSLGGASGVESFVMSSSQMPAHSHVVNSHSHGGTTGLNNQDHSHGYSFTTGTESADHAHAFSGTVDHDGGHQHAPGLGGNFVTSASSSTAGIGAGTGYGLVGVTDYYTGHVHTFSGATGGRNAAHTHSGSGSTGGVSASHNHNITAEAPGTSSVGSGTSMSVVQPYLLLYGIVRL